MWSRRWLLSAVAIAAVGLVVSLHEQSVAPRAALPGLPLPVALSPARGYGAGPSAADIPHVNLEAVARAASAGRRRPPGTHAWADAIQQRVFPAAEPVPTDEGAAAAASPPDTPRDDRNIPELMVCTLDARGAYDASAALQECIDRAPAYSSIEVPPGVYVLHHQVIVKTPLTIRTAGSGGTPPACTADDTQCAVFVASPDLVKQWGPLLVWSTADVTLEHLVIDGNRLARVNTAPTRLCLEGDNTFAFNASVIDCTNCTVNDVVSRNAVCGTGMVWVGAGATIQRSAFRSNGTAAMGLWSDGLTLLSAPYSVVTDNEFTDNSDVALIIGYGVNSRVERNVVVQQTQPAFAGLMLHNFGSENLRTSGDFRGATVTGNTVDCGPQLCVFGIEVGPGPWNRKLIVIGGDVHDNEVRGAKVGINVDGAGIPVAPVVIRKNAIRDVPEGSYFSDCARPIAADSMNVSPGSLVNRGEDTTPIGTVLSDWCQLSSRLSPDPRSGP